jgi:hypothetical protein
MSTMPMPHSVDVIFPAVTSDGRGNMTLVYDSPPATTVSTRAWLQQDTGDESPTDGRNPQTRRWFMIIVLPNTVFTGNERIVWTGAPGAPVTFDAWGPAEPTFTPRGYHHTEVSLRRVDG